MLTIILGFIAVLLLCKLIFYLTEVFPVLAACIILCAIITAGILLPISGYTDWKQVSETKLVSLSNDLGTEGSRFIYVSCNSNVYTYRYEIDSKFGTPTSKEYETDTITGNVTEIEDPNCYVPVLRTYERRGKKSIWTFASHSTEYKYVFYVPEGTIFKEMSV